MTGPKPEKRADVLTEEQWNVVDNWRKHGSALPPIIDYLVSELSLCKSERDIAQIERRQWRKKVGRLEERLAMNGSSC